MFWNDFLIYSVILLIGIVTFILVIGWRSVFNPIGPVLIYLIIFTVTYWLKPIADYLWVYVGRYDDVPLLFHQHLEKISVAVFLALFSFSIGYRVSKSLYSSSPPSATSELSTPSDPQKLNKLQLLLLVTILSFGYWSLFNYSVFPGISDHYSGFSIVPTRAGGIFVENTGYLVKGHLFIATGCILCYAWTRNYWLTLLVGGPWILGKLYQGWGRNSLMIFFLAFFVLTLIQARQTRGIPMARQRNWFHLTISVVLVLGFLIIFPVIRYQRDFFQAHGPSPSRIISGIQEAYALRHRGTLTEDLAGFNDSLYFLAQVPKTINYQYGIEYLYKYLIAPIPRMLWREKPLGYTDWSVTRWLEIRVPFSDPRRYGAAPGSIGEAYLNGGWLGIILIFGLTGFCLSLANTLFLQQRTSPAIQTGYAMIYGYICLLGRDSFLSVFPFFLLFTGIPVAIAFFLETRTNVLIFSKVGGQKQYHGKVFIGGKSGRLKKSRGL